MMNKVIVFIILILFHAPVYSQEADKTSTAYQVIISRWKNATQNYEDEKTTNCNVEILWLDDRIEIKNGGNTIYYTELPAIQVLDGDLHITQWQCRDRLGTKCRVQFIYGGDNMILIITYEHYLRLTYILKNPR